MTTGDALRDMPTEYIEYRRGRDTAMDRLKAGGVATHEEDEPAESEADKAIADGLPRWIKIGDYGDLSVPNGGWKYGVIKRRAEYAGADFLFFGRGDAAIPSAMLFPSILELCVKEILPYGELPPAAEPEKPKAAASIVFKYDGGEWLHMAKHIEVANIRSPHENIFQEGARTFRKSPWYEFTIRDTHLDLLSLWLCDKGRLEITIHPDGSECKYEGEGEIIGMIGSDGSPAISTSRVPFVVFRMKLDAESEYEPDSLDNSPPFTFQIHEAHGPLCPDCDSHTESRSMPGGIEQWCSVCNVKVGEGAHGYFEHWRRREGDKCFEIVGSGNRHIGYTPDKFSANSIVSEHNSTKI